MKLLVATSIFLSLMDAAFAQVRVDGHTRKDGTYVARHYRSQPDNSYNNNWTTSPNRNPYTGEKGSSQPTWNDKAPNSNPYALPRPGLL